MIKKNLVTFIISIILLPNFVYASSLFEIPDEVFSIPLSIFVFSGILVASLLLNFFLKKKNILLNKYFLYFIFFNAFVIILSLIYLHIQYFGFDERFFYGTSFHIKSDSSFIVLFFEALYYVHIFSFMAILISLLYHYNKDGFKISNYKIINNIFVLSVLIFNILLILSLTPYGYFDYIHFNMDKCELCKTDLKYDCLTERAFNINDYKICRSIEDDSFKNKCFDIFAHENNNPNICKEITNEWSQYYCIEGIAEKNKNPEACNLIQDEYLERECLKYAEN